MSSHSDRQASPSTTELIPSIGSTRSDLPCLPNHSSSGTTSHGPYNIPGVQNPTLILYETREELQTYGESHEHAVTINTLSDYVLLEIFDACRKAHDPNDPPFIPAWRWHGLAHVCRRWRQVVFGSPRRLDLQIFCTNGTRVRENLDIWPPFPISIHYSCSETLTPRDEDSLFAALEHPGRICYVELRMSGPQLSEVAMMIQEPLPALEHLILDASWVDERALALPSGFLGGSAPRLRYMRLEYVPFPTLPTLLSSASNLVELYLLTIPEVDYISPEAMVACLAALPKLESLDIEFHSELAASHHDRIPLPPVTRTILPALTTLRFLGDSAYLEEFVSLIDGPQLRRIYVHYWNRFLAFRVAQLFMFIDRSDTHEKNLINAVVALSNHSMAFESPESDLDQCRIRITGISDMAQMFNHPSKILSHVVHLKLWDDPSKVGYSHAFSEWPLLLCKFSAVRTLRASQIFARQVALALEDITAEMVTQVLPALDLICLDGQPASSLEKFLEARQLAGLPVTIVDTEVEFDERVKSY